MRIYISFIFSCPSSDWRQAWFALVRHLAENFIYLGRWSYNMETKGLFWLFLCIINDSNFTWLELTIKLSIMTIWHVELYKIDVQSLTKILLYVMLQTFSVTVTSDYLFHSHRFWQRMWICLQPTMKFCIAVIKMIQYWSITVFCRLKKVTKDQIILLKKLFEPSHFTGYSRMLGVFVYLALLFIQCLISFKLLTLFMLWFYYFISKNVKTCTCFTAKDIKSS